MESIHGRALKSVGLFLFLFVVLFSLTLNQVHAYPAPKFQDVLVCSVQNDNGTGSIFTLFYARVSGPSPEDVTSFTATGPSGTFPLTSNRSSKEKGLYYAVGYSEGTGIIDPGAYTFQVTDSLGRSVTEVRNFSYDGTLPQVDSATMIPGNEAYVGTTTPTLSFDPVAGAVYYQVIIQDYDRTAIWYSSPATTATSFTVPSGLLQPNTAYIWQARVWDSATNAQNLQVSNPFSFYTGTKATPEVNGHNVLSFPTGVDDILLFPYGSGINVAPWDISYFRCTGPDLAVYDLATYRVQFNYPAYYSGAMVFDPPTTIPPDGTYTFDIQDDLARTASVTSSYTYNPIPDFIADTRLPDNNAYIDTLPTFSWSRVQGDPGDGTYQYSIRIMDYSGAMRWIDSTWSSDTTFIPSGASGLPVGTSYKWRVNVISGGNNYRTSGNRTITINGPACYVNKDDSTCGGKSPCYTSIQSAIDAADTGYDIRVAQGIYTEPLDLATSKSLTLQGGWDSSFTTQTSNTTFIKSPTVTQGSLTMQMLTIKP